MKALLQRVNYASVTVDREVIGSIGPGLVALVGVADGDSKRDIDYLTDKLLNLRIFADESGKFNLSLLDIKGELLLISQFTLLADSHKGRRPSFTDAAPPEAAARLFNELVAACLQSGARVETGRFQAHMQVVLVNDGPVTVMLDSRQKFGGA